MRYIPIILVLDDDDRSTVEVLNDCVHYDGPVSAVIFGPGTGKTRHPEEAIEAAFMFAESLEAVPKS